MKSTVGEKAKILVLISTILFVSYCVQFRYTQNISHTVSKNQIENIFYNLHFISFHFALLCLPTGKPSGL